MLLAIDKPSGITSYDVIRRLKRLFPKQKIGHSGTLDPLATGLLIIGIERSGTRQLSHLQGLDKSYETVIDFSQMSDTWDVDFWEEYLQYPLSTQGKQSGIEKEGSFVAAPDQESIEQKLHSLIPEKELPLTPFSAKKVGGKKLYELARSGQIVTSTRIMKTMDVRILSYTFPLLQLDLSVGSGTYIRSIGYGLGQEFGLGGILTSLRRTRIGKFTLSELELKELGDSGLMGVEIEL